MKPEKDIKSYRNVEIGDQVKFSKGIDKVLNLYENTILVEYSEKKVVKFLPELY